MRTKLTPLGRLVVVVALALSAAFAGAAGATARKPHAQEWRCVLVRPGDTLWRLARTVAPDEDPRRVVSSIRLRNRLPHAAVLAGEALWVPWDGDGDLPGGGECGYLR